MQHLRGLLSFARLDLTCQSKASNGQGQILGDSPVVTYLQF